MFEIKNDKIDAFTKAREDYLKMIREEGETLLAQVVGDFFTYLPECEYVAWTQYIPSFNDGDPCVFSTGEVYFISNETTLSYDEILEEIGGSVDGFEDLTYDQESGVIALLENNSKYGTWEWDAGYKSKTYSSPRAEEIGVAIKEFCKFLQDNQELLEKALGSNASILCSRTHGIKVDEYYCGY